MEREDILNDLTGNDQPDAQHTELELQDAPPAEQNEEAKTEPAGLMESEAVNSFLDSISSEPGKKAAQPSAEKVEKAPAAEAPPEAGKEAPQEPPKAADPDAEALIAEMGVKSERGQERIRSVISARKEAEAKAAELAGKTQEYERDIGEFKQMVQSTGMVPEEFAQMLEVGRLMKTGNPQDAMMALQAIDQQRAILAKQLGVDMPGVDPLADFPQLQAAVENLEISREHALQLAKYQRNEQMQQQSRQAQQREQQEAVQYQQEIAGITKTAESYFKTLEHEADYPAKLAQISAKFKDPAFMQEFVTTYQPKQWFSALKMMYDAIVVPAAPRVAEPQPIRARSQHVGAPAANPAETNIDRLSSIMQSMGI